MSAAHSLRNLGKALLGLPVLAKVTGIAVGLIAILAVSLAWQIDHSYYQLEEQELQEQAGFVAEVIAVGAEPLLRIGDEAAVRRMIETMGNLTPATGTSIKLLQLKTADGRLFAYTGNTLPVPGEQEFHKSVALSGSLRGQVSAVLGDGHIGYEVGWHKERILWTTLIISLLGMVTAWWLMRLITRPVRELVRATRAVKAGDYKARSLVHASDEIGELAAAFNEMVEALQQKEEMNRRLTRKLMTSEEELRKCLAHELQDQTGQALASLIAGLAAMESGADTRRLPEMRSLAAKTLTELHDLSLTLRPTALEDLGLVSALQKVCRDVSERFGVKADCAAVGFDETKRLARDIEVALYRIGQEALTNAVRHGHARTIDVLLQRKEASILAVIEDDGTGFDASQWRERCLKNDCLGLLRIEERAALLGGSFRVESRLGGGTSLFVEIPLGEAA